MSSETRDVAVIGGGIVGMATAKALLESTGASLVVLEAEKSLAAHQTGNNSGVIHSGLYYKPGSLKARNCVAGREALYRFCAEHDIPHERCGKVVVATHESQIPALDTLEERGRANGLQGLERLSPEAIKQHEPHVRGVEGLLVPETGIVDFKQVTETYAALVRKMGGAIHTGTRVVGFRNEHVGLVLNTTRGSFHCRYLVNCGGLQSDRIARMCGVRPGVRIIPFRGEYYELLPQSTGLVRNLIYPVPDPKFPFLGVHFTRMIHGGAEAGPNAVLAFKREGYKPWSFSLRDLAEIVSYPGFWRMAAKYWRTGFGEFYRSFRKAAFVASMQEMIPEITSDDVKRGGAGVRAQAVSEDGKLVDDFRIEEGDRTIHVLNAPSPAATASLSIGEAIAALAEQSFFAKK
ncbi:MAG: L-2-hydroxyglutarate oxidase [Planctomycetota bacterium]